MAAGPSSTFSGSTSGKPAAASAALSARFPAAQPCVFGSQPPLRPWVLGSVCAAPCRRTGVWPRQQPEGASADE
eukprot:611815-Alexandrium_andersonii.AAC.1